MLEAPTFNVPLGSEISGDDPLGLAPVNERLYGSVFPGINNVVRYIRVYGLLCWAAWRVERYLVGSRRTFTTRQVTELFTCMREKVELLITWANVERHSGVPGLVGTRRKFPEADQRVTLRFEAFGSNEAAYMSAVQYRPSITNGLGFMEARAYDTFACTAAGVALAEAIDAALHTSPHYAWLSKVDALSTRRSQVLELRAMFDVEHPRRREQDVFLTRFWPDTAEGEDISLDANRRSGMLLALRAVQAVNAWSEQQRRKSIGVSASDIRAAMARGCAPDGEPLSLNGVERAQAKWLVLQLRQYQRTCYEAFYVGLEYLLSGAVPIKDRSRTGVASLMGKFAEAAVEENEAPKVEDLEKEVRALQGREPSLYRAALREGEADVFRRRARLLETEPEVEDGSWMVVLGEAAMGLVYCAVEAENLASDSRMRPYLGLDEDKKPLSRMPAWLARFRARPVRELVAHIVLHDVIDRHFDVVRNRSRGGDEKNRFRFIDADNGLRRYDEGRDVPRLGEAEDRLARALDLLEQCSLLQRDESGYVLTMGGGRLLARYAALK